MSVEKPAEKKDSRLRAKPFSQGNVPLRRYFRLVKVNPASWSWLEFITFVGGGLGGGWVAYQRYAHNSSPIPIAASLVGLTIGALIAGMAIMAWAHSDVQRRRIGCSQPT